jgi:DNA-binding PadR family transcriptional regulator
MTEKQVDAYEKISQELRRGLVILAALSRLKKQQYGYSLISELSEEGLEIEQGTLYPLLRRLEAQGLLDSNWDVGGSRPRRYYVLNETGEAVLKSLSSDWYNLVDVMEKLLG